MNTEIKIPENSKTGDNTSGVDSDDGVVMPENNIPPKGDPSVVIAKDVATKKVSAERVALGY